MGLKLEMKTRRSFGTSGIARTQLRCSARSMLRPPRQREVGEEDLAAAAGVAEEAVGPEVAPRGITRIGLENMGTILQHASCRGTLAIFSAAAARESNPVPGRSADG